MTCQFNPTVPKKAAVGDEIVADVVDLEAAAVAVAQQQVGRIVAEEAAESDKLPIGSDLAQLIRCEQRVVADVVDFILPCRQGAVRGAQDHVRGRAGGRRRVRRDRQQEAVRATGIGITPNDLAGVVDSHSIGRSAIRNVKGRVGPAAIKKSVVMIVRVMEEPDDLARIVDIFWKSKACDGIDERSVSGGAGVEKKTVRLRSGMIKSDDLTGCVNASYGGTGRRLRRIYGGEKPAAIEKAVLSTTDGIED